VSLPPGARIGPYEVVAKLGEGGMGEVYRARDARLERDVAIKIVPDAFANDAERLARFEREAKTLASLNHPHIAHVYGFEQSGTTRALVMELVEGEDLSARIRRGPLPLDEALPIARQIADALESAHEAGIVHRDLKPANVKVRADGTVKVLDFGLAKVFEPGSGIREPGSAPDLSHSPTITSPAMTMRGVILGTAAYMSPEQAKGRFVDKRADIWAFGCVLYEMLTGKRAFDGEDVSDTLASVLRAEPDWFALTSRSTPAITTVVRRCLARDPRQRTRDVGDVRLQLEEAQSATPQEVAVDATSRRRWLPAAVAGIAAVAALAVAAPAVWRSRPAADPPMLRFGVAIPDGYRIHRLGTANRLSFSLSPDGRRLAAVLTSARSGRRVFMRRLDEAEFREVPGTDGAFAVTWAPDSNRFAVVSASGIKFTSLSGGSSLAPIVLPAYGPTVWAEDDRLIAFGGPGQDVRRWRAGEQPSPGTVAPGVTAVMPADVLPNGGLLLARTNPPPQSNVTLIAQTARGSSDLMTLDVRAAAGVSALYRSGYLLIARVERAGRGALTAQPFDPATATLSGQPIGLMSGLNQAISASETGILAFAQVQESTQEVVWLDERGNLISRVLGNTSVENLDLSPDDRMVVMQDAGALRLHDLQRGVTTTLAPAGADPVWSGDGRQVAFVINTPEDRGVHVMPANGGASRRVYASKTPIFIDGWSLDGKWIAAHTNRVGGTDQKGEGFLIPMTPGVQPVVFSDTTDERAVDETRFAPDGRWLAFGLTNVDTGEVFLMPVPPTGERWQVSVAGGAQPRWSGDGRSLFYLALDGTLMRVDVDPSAGPAPKISAPRPVLQTGVDVALNIDQFAVSRDGKRFLLRRPEIATDREEIQLIVNWPELLKRQ
jgi:serine/threonine protein kinase